MSTSGLLELLEVGTFAERLLGRPLWPYQLDFARSSARYRCWTGGRQVGKSTVLAVCALHTAFTRAGQTVLLVSAGEVASRRLLEECASLATSSPLLAGAVLDESKAQLVLGNGSRILSVPASQRQIRGWPVDLLILDEAGFIDPEVWRAAEPSIIARPGSRVILSSSPWGDVEHFFRRLWQRGMDAPSEQLRSWHVPSIMSPLVDRKLLEEIREREAPDYFAREYEAAWTDEAGAYFAESEIMLAVADYELLDPAQSWFQGQVGQTVAGVDWGMARDANAVVVVGLLDDEGLNSDGRWRLFVPWLEARYRMPWSQFIDRLCVVAGALNVSVMASETNGVGAYPTDDLKDRLWKYRGPRSGTTYVYPVVTDLRRKQSGFGMVRSLLQGGRLVLPRDPELLKQLRSLQFEQLPAGGTRISVPDRVGHDDLVMALMQAVSCVAPQWLEDGFEGRRVVVPGDAVETAGGVLVPRRPLPVAGRSFLVQPRGVEGGEGW